MENLEELISLAEGAKKYGVHPDYLRFLVLNGKVRVQKIGRNWITTASWLDEYFTRHRRNGESNYTECPANFENGSASDVAAPAEKYDIVRPALSIFLLGISMGVFSMYAYFSWPSGDTHNKYVNTSAISLSPDIPSTAYKVYIAALGIREEFLHAREEMGISSHDPWWAVDSHHTRRNGQSGFQSVTQLLGFTHQPHRSYQYISRRNKNNTLVSEGDVFSPLLSVMLPIENRCSKYSKSAYIVSSPNLWITKMSPPNPS